MEPQENIIPASHARNGSIRGLRRSVGLFILALGLVSFVGCAGRFRHLMYNYMCDPHGQCGPHCQHAGENITPTYMEPAQLPDPAMSTLGDPALMEQVQQLQEDSTNLRQQLTLMHQQMGDREDQMAKLMQKLTTSVRVVGQELDTKRSEIADLEAQVQQQRVQSDDALHSVEKELNQLLAEFGSEALDE